MEQLTKEDIDFLRYALDVYIFESGDESEYVSSLRERLISICKEE
jgi:hypothetical protein